MKYVSVEQMIAIEKEADASGHTYDVMMAHAGRGLAEAVLDDYGYLAEGGALGLVGSGNNGGDTLVALVHLLEAGWKASACILRPRPEDDPLVERLEQAGGAIHRLDKDIDLERLADLRYRCAGCSYYLHDNLAQVSGLLLPQASTPPFQADHSKSVQSQCTDS